MIRAAAVLAVMVLLGNNGLPRRMWPGTASAAATKVPGYVVRWVDRYNAALARAKLTYRVVMISRCRPYGEAFTVCTAIVESSTHKVGCYRVTVSVTSTLWSAPPVSCASIFKPAPPAA